MSREGSQERGPSRAGPGEAAGARERGTKNWKTLRTRAAAMGLGRQTERPGRREGGPSRGCLENWFISMLSEEQ